MTESKIEYLSEPIIPGEEIGGISLGVSKSELRGELPKPVHQKQPDPDSEWLLYRGLTVYLVDDEVTDLAAQLCYKGSTPSGVKVGTTWETLKSTHPDLYFEEQVTQGWIPPENSGIYFSIGKVRLTEWDLNRASYQVKNFPYQIKEPGRAEVTSVGVYEGDRLES